MQAFFDTLLEDDKEEEQEAQTHREEERKKKVLQDLEVALKSLAYNIQNLHPYLIAYQDKEIPEIEAFIEKIDLFEDNKFYKVNYKDRKLTQFAKIIAIDNDICYKIRKKKFNLNRTIRMEIKNEPKQNPNI